MNKFEFKNLVKSLKESLKEKSFFKDLRKEVETGANGTQDYVVKKGINKKIGFKQINHHSTSKMEQNHIP